MTFTLTVSATDWSAVGATPSRGQLELGLLNPVLSDPITTSKRWYATLDETGAGSWDVPAVPAGNALVVRSRVAGLWQGRTFYFGDPGAGSHSLSELVSSWQVDPATLEPSVEALAGWDAAVAATTANAAAGVLSAEAAEASHVAAESARIAAQSARADAEQSASAAQLSQFAAADSAAEAQAIADGITTGGVTSYLDLTDKPFIPDSPDDIGAQPAGSYAPTASPTFTGTVSGVTKGMVGLGSVDNTSDASKPVSTAQQAALDLKAPLASPTFTGTVSGVTKGMVGLGNVDNTSDTAKPVSTATQTALDLKAPIASPTFTGTVSGVTKSMVGLANVDNTSDANKPVSTAQATAIGAKADTSALTAHTGNTSNPHAVTKAQVGLGNVDNTADTAKPVSTAQQTALDAKAPTLIPSYVGTRANGWNASTSIYNADSVSLRNLRKAIAKAGGGTCRIAFVGDSVTSAAGTNPGTDDPVTKLRQRLQGLGYTVGEIVSLANRANGGNFQDSRVALSGTWGQAGVNFPYLYSSTNGSTITYNSAVAGTVVEIVYGNGTGTFTYSIDGATAVSVTGTNTGANATRTVTGLSNTRHKVVITLSGSVEVDFAAVGVRSTTGVVLITQGIGGSATNDWSADTSWFRPLGVTAAMSPDVVVVELGLNDGYYGTVPVATYKTNLGTILNYWVTAGVTPLLTASHVLGGTYVSAIYDQADTFDIPLLDLRDRIGGDTTTTASITGDGVHFTAQGYQIKSRAWADLLLLHTPVDLEQVACLPGSFALAPRIAQYGMPPGMLTSSNGAPVNQRTQFSPFFVGPTGWTVDALRAQVTVAAAGGAGLSFNVALYADDGTGWPDTSRQLAVGTATDFGLTAIATRTTVLATPVVLKPGLYWTASLYQYTTVPTTAPQVLCFSNVTWQLGIPAANALSGVPRGLTLTGQTTFPTTTVAEASFSTSTTTDVPVVALRRSA